LGVSNNLLYQKLSLVGKNRKNRPIKTGLILRRQASYQGGDEDITVTAPFQNICGGVWIKHHALLTSTLLGWG
jgi:hypothetical protein